MNLIWWEFPPITYNRKNSTSFVDWKHNHRQTIVSPNIIPNLLTTLTLHSPFTPYAGLKLVELMQATFPPGVVQAIGGNDELGRQLCLHPDISKITFTGSIPTGKKVMEACSQTLKRVTLELGGNDASIIFPDIDIKKVAQEVVTGAFQNTGQTCVATKRIYIHESIYQEFLQEMIDFTKTIKVGPPDDENTLLGPIQNARQYDKVKGFFDDSRENGYTFAVGDTNLTTAPTSGFFVPPTIIDNPPNDSRIIVEETFGPIVPTQPWSDVDEVIRRANNSNMGLGACVWSGDVEQFVKQRRPYLLYEE